MKKRKKQKRNTSTGIQKTINKLFKVGGELNIKTLRYSKKSIHPRKFLISLTIPVVVNKDNLDNDATIQYLIGRSIYKGCITEINQTSPKYCAITFSMIVKDKDNVQNFIQMLTNLAFDVKAEMETKYCDDVEVESSSK